MEQIKAKKPLKIFILYYDDATSKLAHSYASHYKFFEPFHLKPSLYLESQVFFYFAQNPKVFQEYEFVGFIASTFEQKVKFFDFEDMVKKEGGGVDCFGLGLGWAHLPLDSMKFHKNLNEIIYQTFKAFGLTTNFLSFPIPCFYYNYVIMRSDKMHLYCNFAQQIYHLWEDGTKKLKTLLMEDATYCGGRQNKQSLIKNFGVPYYPHHTFCMERIIGAFAYVKKWKMKRPKRK